MVSIKKVSDWTESSEETLQSDCILTEPEHPRLYGDAREAYETQKLNFEPIEQLSPKGLALLMSCFADKEGHEAQPVVASCIDDLKHATGLVCDAPVGTQLTLIFQMTDKGMLGPFFGKFGREHKTVLKLEKTEAGVEVVHMDSTNNDVYQTICMALVTSVCQKKDVKWTFYSQDQIMSPNKENTTFSRQVDAYQCGTFAIKDARMLNRDEAFLTHVKTRQAYPEISEIRQYEMPAAAFKSIQHRGFTQHALNTHANTEVTRKGRTLQQTHEKHQATGYIQHFSQKYRDIVMQKIESPNSTPESIRAAVEQYDAGSLTPERLAAVYGPEPSVEASPEVQQASMKAELGTMRSQEADKNDTPNTTPDSTSP